VDRSLGGRGHATWAPAYPSVAPTQTPGSTSDPGALRDDCSSAPLVVVAANIPSRSAAIPNTSTQGPARSDNGWLGLLARGCHGRFCGALQFAQPLCRFGHRRLRLPVAAIDR
jgi:hypothetical protein